MKDIFKTILLVTVSVAFYWPIYLIACLAGLFTLLNDDRSIY